MVSCWPLNSWGLMAALQNQAVQSMWKDEDEILSFMEKVKECINSLSKSSLTNQEILDCTNKAGKIFG